MSTVYFISHPEVIVDSAVPVTEWALSEIGAQRMQAFVKHPTLTHVSAVFASSERKAVQAARLLSEPRGLPLEIIKELGENDRSSTGYLEKTKFEAAADAFFAAPTHSFHGWETAHDAQKRIVRAIDQIISKASTGDLAIISHGAVGTLFKCSLKAIPITRSEDQSNQGNYYAFDSKSRHLLHDWLPIK